MSNTTSREPGHDRTLILASTSPHRRSQMDRLGVSYEAVPPNYVERHDTATAPREAVLVHSRSKAASLAAEYPRHLIIGSDQMAVIDGKRLGKPKTAERAKRQLELLSGREHELLTGVAVHSTLLDREEWELDVCKMRMRHLDREEIEAYVARDAPLSCAGSYKFEAAGAALFDGVDTADPTAIVGLPLIRLVRLLSRFGYRVLSTDA